MAGLFSSEFPKSFRLLDPGAGIGSLTAAVCDRLLDLRSPRNIEIHLFENDPGVLPLLHQSVAHCCKSLQAAGHEVRYLVHENDFIIDAAATVFGEPFLFSTDDYGQFDAVIMNPPYFKVNKGSTHARVMQDVVHGQPNIYAFFMAAGVELLGPDGELAAITPRSFCNGLYFRGFRHWLSERVSLEHIHLFESLTDTFRDVLQENIGCNSTIKRIRSSRLREPQSGIKHYGPILFVGSQLLNLVALFYGQLPLINYKGSIAPLSWDAFYSLAVKTRRHWSHV